MFLHSQTRRRQELPEQEIGKNGRNMRRMARFVHHAQSARQQEFQARGERVDVWRSDYSNTVLRQEAGDIAQKTDGTLDVLDHFHGKHQIERTHTQGVGERGLAELQLTTTMLSF